MATKRTSVEVEFKADMSRWDTAMNTGIRGLQSFRGGLNKLGRAVFSVQGAVGGLAGAAGLGYLWKSQADVIDRTAKLSRALDISTKGFIGLNHAVGLTSSVTRDQLGQALKDMQKSIGEGKSVFEDLGLEVEKLKQLAPEEQFFQISDALAAVGDNASRIALSEQIFAEPGTQLLNTLTLGSEKIREMAAEADALGIAFSGLDATQVENANDALTRSIEVLEGLKNRVTVTLAPLVENLATSFSDAAKETGGFNEQVKDAVMGLGYVLDVVSNTGFALKGLWKFADTAVSAYLNGWTQMAEFFFKIGDGIKISFATVANFAIEQIDKILAAWQNVADKVKLVPGLGALSPGIAAAREGLAGMRRAETPLLNPTRMKVGGMAAASSRNMKEAWGDFIEHFEGGLPGMKVTGLLEEMLDNGGRVEAILKPMEEQGTTVLNKMAESVEVVTEKVVEMGKKSETVMTRFLKTGELTWDGFKKSALDSIAAVLTGPGGMDGLIMDIFGGSNASGTGLLGGIFGGSAGGGGILGNILGSFGGLFADGGKLKPGQWGILGENGPEPVYGGNTGATILPNSVMGGGGSVTYNFNVSNFNEFPTSLEDVKNTVRSVTPHIVDSTISALDQRTKRGGGF